MYTLKPWKYLLQHQFFETKEKKVYSLHPLLDEQISDLKKCEIYLENLILQ